MSKIATTEKNEFLACKNQLNAVTELRHGLIHRGAKLSGVEIRSTNEFMAKSEEAVEIMTLHMDDLKAAATDCRNMELRLLSVMFPDEVKIQLGEFVDKVFQPWLYKHVQPSKPNQPLRKVRPAKQPRRKPSPG